MRWNFSKKIYQGRLIIEGDELWSYKGSGKPKRRYAEDYPIIGELADILRLSEHKQGLARTRYLFHDVDFYVLSKDRVDEYEPLAEIMDVQFRSDIFLPRKERSDKKYDEVKNAVTKWLEKNSCVRIANIHRITGISRRIVTDHLSRMVDEKILIREKIGVNGGVYRYPLGKKRIVAEWKSGTALNRQARIDQYGFPFTLNPIEGCFFSCKYCYVPEFMKISRERFGKEVKVKTWLPEILDKELNSYRDLPQHLKRVQINESCESYLAEVMHRMKKELNRDLMAEILAVFEKHWLAGNKWMVHIITKSNLITRHIEILSRLKHMVQVEISFACLDETLRREIERYAPSTNKRLMTVRKLSDAGIFVRIMAMPLITGGNEKEEGWEKVDEMRRTGFQFGAKAFKHKGLNYFDPKDLLKGRIIKKRRRRDFVYDDLIVNSGEHVKENGQIKKVRLVMPEKWKGKSVAQLQDNLVEKDTGVINCGYSQCNGVDWGYIV